MRWNCICAPSLILSDDHEVILYRYIHDGERRGGKNAIRKEISIEDCTPCISEGYSF